MAAKEWFKDWFNSPFYHKLYFERDEQEAQQFIHRLLRRLDPTPGSLMLDVACGRGRHSKLLAEAGFDVTGIDLSPDSILFAKQFEHEKLHFYQHDMRLPAWINYFDYAFNFFTSFGYFATRREHDDAASTITKSLRPHGTLVFDYLNVHYTEERLVHNEERTIGTTSYEIHRWMDESFFYKRITITDPSLSQPMEFTEKISKLSLGDFTDLLSFQQMQIVEVFGDYELNSYDIRTTPRLIIMAKKIH
ncbi:MAG TPA: methyltransferase domain-containing protein [Flavisolibacter sp.]|nr:methyltransferase domain-containing protein [Flavisolibacter sp.]